MASDPSALLEREKAILRLLLVGHDAKSIARELDLSTNVVNERLRDARRKLGVGSSREAARMLASLEGDSPKKFGDKQIGYRDEAVVPEEGATAEPSQAVRPHRQFNNGMIVMIAISAALIAGAAYWAGIGAAAPTTTATVVSTLPSNGSVIEPGPYRLTVTFDRPMAPGSFSFVQVNAASYPKCSGQPEQSKDGRSFTLQCVAKKAMRHEIWFNRQPYMNFRAKADGQSATPYRLRFSVKP